MDDVMFFVEDGIVVGVLLKSEVYIIDIFLYFVFLCYVFDWNG